MAVVAVEESRQDLLDQPTQDEDQVGLGRAEVEHLAGRPGRGNDEGGRVDPGSHGQALAPLGRQEGVPGREHAQVEPVRAGAEDDDPGALARLPVSSNSRPSSQQ